MTTKLSSEQVKDEVLAAYETQCMYQLSLHEHDNFIVPLTPSFIKRTWNEHAYQMRGQGQLS